MSINFQPETIYHIYNRGNQQQNIFFNDDNYIYFLEKVRKYISPRCELLCWCLMPNRFHFLVYTSKESTQWIPKTPIPIQNLTEGIRLLLSSYTKGLQKQQGFKGNLFQQKTKAKAVSDNDITYAATAFHYIHQNPCLPTGRLIKLTS
jgi:putative transposase